MSKDSSSSSTPPEDLPKVDGGPAPGAGFSGPNAAHIGVEDTGVTATRLDERATMKATASRWADEAVMLNPDAVRSATIRPAGIRPGPLDLDQQERAVALREARAVLEATTGGPVFSSGSKTPPNVDDLIRVARYIVTGIDPNQKD